MQQHGSSITIEPGSSSGTKCNSSSGREVNSHRHINGGGISPKTSSLYSRLAPPSARFAQRVQHDLKSTARRGPTQLFQCEMGLLKILPAGCVNTRSSMPFVLEVSRSLRAAIVLWRRADALVRPHVDTCTRTRVDDSGDESERGDKAEGRRG